MGNSCKSFAANAHMHLLLASIFAVMVDLLFFKNLICIDLL